MIACAQLPSSSSKAIGTKRLPTGWAWPAEASSASSSESGKSGRAKWVNDRLPREFLHAKGFIKETGPPRLAASRFQIVAIRPAGLTQHVVVRCIREERV